MNDTTRCNCRSCRRLTDLQHKLAHARAVRAEGRGFLRLQLYEPSGEIRPVVVGADDEEGLDAAVDLLEQEIANLRTALDGRLHVKRPRRTLRQSKWMRREKITPQ